jgi:hypothetical protein
MGTHSLFSPSGAHKWIKCHGAIFMEQGLPDETTEYAAEGTAAHELAKLTLLDGTHPSARISAVIKVDKHEFKVDAEMAGYVNTYVQFIRQQRDLLGGVLVVEERVDYSAYVDFPDSGGSLDAGIWAGNEIQVHDLKYGMGEKVEAVENWQLMLYALGLYAKWQLFLDNPTFRLFIHQPRLQYEPSEWTCTLDDLLALAEKAKHAVARASSLLAEGAVVTEQDLVSNYLNPGEKQCRWCKAKAKCPALAKQVFDTVGASFEDLTNPFIDTKEAVSEQIEASTAVLEDDPADFLSQSMDQVGLIEMWCKAVRAEVERRLLLDEPVPRYKLVEGRKGHRAWLDETEVEKTMKKWRVKHEQMYKYALISPTDAEKLLKKTKPKWWAELQDDITQAKGKPSVAPESDPRPAYTVKKAKVEDFSNLDLEALL